MYINKQLFTNSPVEHLQQKHTKRKHDKRIHKFQTYIT